LIAVLADVDPGSRALLDLSVRWRVADERVARLLRTDAGDIARRRAGVMEGVAGALGVDPLHGLAELRAGLAELPAEAWGVPVPERARAVVADGRSSGAAAPDRADGTRAGNGAATAARPGPLAGDPASTGSGLPEQPAGPGSSQPHTRDLAAVPTAAPTSARPLAALAPRRGRTVLAVAVGAFIGAVLGRRFR